MNRELEVLKWITLGSIGVLCGLLLLVVWLAMRIGEISCPGNTTPSQTSGVKKTHSNARRIAHAIIAAAKGGGLSGSTGIPAMRSTDRMTASHKNAPAARDLDMPRTALSGDVRVDDTVEYAALFRSEPPPLRTGETAPAGGASGTTTTSAPSPPR